MKRSVDAIFAFLFIGIFGFMLFSLMPGHIGLNDLLLSLKMFSEIPLNFWLAALGMFFFAFTYSVYKALHKQQRRDDLKTPIQSIYRTVNEKTKKFFRRPQHRPAIDDTKAVRMILDSNKSYREVYDEIYPPTQGKAEVERLSYFDNKWRPRVSQKVNKEIKKSNKYKP